ncbi:MAG: HDIG domain-containing protein [Phycisphaerales bacterium]|nr:HDIG domain-containing protein [Phycisphaerales bacterium]
MRLFARQTARQKEIRRSKAERRLTWYHRVSEHLHVPPLAYLLLCATCAAIIVNAGAPPLLLQVGERAPRAITARVAFRIEDERATQVERMRARDRTEDYYTLDATLLRDLAGRLSSAIRLARESAGDTARLIEQAAALDLVLDPAGAAELLQFAADPEDRRFAHAVDRAIELLMRQPLVEANDSARRGIAINAILVDPQQQVERAIPITRLLFSNNPEHVVTVIGEAAHAFPEALRPAMVASLRTMLRTPVATTAKPLYRYDFARSTREAQAAADRVVTQYVEYSAGATLADAGTISADELLVLREEQRQYLARRDVDPAFDRAHRLAAFARGAVAFVLVFGLGGYIFVVHRKSLGPPLRRLVMAAALLLILGLVRATVLYTPYPHATIGLHALAVTLLAVVSRRGPAYATTGLMALLIALAAGQDATFLATLVVLSIVLFLGLREIRSRGRIVMVGGIAAVLVGLLTFLDGLMGNQELQFILETRVLWAVVATLVATFLVEGTLPLIEQFFGVTTSMTLLEWCDPNRPLLRMLAAESPGTYNHSLLVGTLAGAAADAIGADGLLARTGSYYHDIGKINKPEYFVENQALGCDNRHERLSPAMSHLVIIAHVKDGVEMAKEYGLPAALRPFIPEHHGTCVVEYFFHAANQARRPGDAEIPESQFRYPGPKPQTKETAIVMMCDTVEGAVRAMSEPTPHRIEDVVDRMIQKRMVDGQFDECDLTFRELAVIRASLVKTLSSVYHGRVRYPSGPKEERKATEARATS